MSSISKDSAVSSLQPESEENFVADIVQLDESIRSAPPPVIVSSPTPPLIEKKKLSDDKKEIVPITTQTLESSNQSSKDQDSFVSSNEEEYYEDGKDFDELVSVNIKQSKVYKDQMPKLSKSFKLCVDSVRMLPDNALTYKLSGKLINIPDKGDSTFSVFPQFDWPHRSPRCECLVHISW